MGCGTEKRYLMLFLGIAFQIPRIMSQKVVLQAIKEVEKAAG
jgi:hypothetical protein